MRKAEEYHRHAEECRKLASVSSNEETRSQLLGMAENWEGLARYREQHLARQQNSKGLGVGL